MNAAFQPVAPADLESVVGFMSRLYAQDAIAFDPVRARRTAGWLLANPEAGGIWLIQAGGEPAGYLVMTVCASLEFHGRYALLDELYLDDAWRGRGFGRQAVEFAAEWARSRGMAAVRLETAHDNAHAQTLYRRCGFILHDRYLMTKWL